MFLNTLGCKAKETLRKLKLEKLVIICPGVSHTFWSTLLKYINTNMLAVVDINTYWYRFK